MEKELKQKLLRQLPSITVLLQQSEVKKLIEDYSHDLVVEAANQVLDKYRQLILEDKFQDDMPDYQDAIAQHLANRFLPRLRNVINATGVVLHTNLGRALLSDSALAAVSVMGAGFSNLELDLATGERGSRYEHVEKLLCEITGAEGAMVVNNNAAAVLLILNTFAQGKEVIVSRGQLVEIGGSFRIPEVMRAGGAKLVEVGTTNKTHLRDYQDGITEETALLLKVHTSNYKITGFTSEVTLPELVQLGSQKGIPVVDDVGSGVLLDLSKFGLPAEPTVQESISLGADLVSFSGDKLFGGPQAGIIVGKAKYIEALKKNQLTRALRVDKLTFAALEATLKLYLDEKVALEQIPTLRMLTMPLEVLDQRARNLITNLNNELARAWEDKFLQGLPAKIQLVDGVSQVGGGALPSAEMPTKLVAIEPQNISVTQLEEMLRLDEQPILARVHKNQLLLDLRTIKPEEEILLIKALVKGICQGGNNIGNS